MIMISVDFYIDNRYLNLSLPVTEKKTGKKEALKKGLEFSGGIKPIVLNIATADFQSEMKDKAIIVVNFKAYAEGVGKKAVELAKLCGKVSKETGVTIIPAVQEEDIYRVSSQVGGEIYSQHMDPCEYGAHTGCDLPELIKENGGTGTLINHSEISIDVPTIRKSIERAREAGITSLVCANTPELAAEVAQFKPDFIAVEPPELIGGDISVSTAKPEIITETIKKVRAVADIPVLCGAGIKDRKDVRIAVGLGSAGILVASGVVKSKEQEKALKELAEGIKEGLNSRA